MISPALVPAVIATSLLGALMLVVASLMEARQLRWAWECLVAAEDDELHDTHRETLLERTRSALMALKLLRMVALFILAPSLLLALSTLPEKLGGLMPANSSLAAVLEAGACGLIIFLIITLVHGAMLRGMRSTAELRHEKRTVPAWLYEEGRPMPALMAAGSLLWGWFHKRSGWLLDWLNIENPRGQLYEQDGEVRLAVGELELGALDEARETGFRKRKDPADRSEKDMIRAIQRLDQTMVREVMRPLIQVTAVSLNNLTPEKFLAQARRTGFTRIPCYYDQITNLIGYLNVYDFLESPVLPRDIRALVHQAPFLPEVARADVALQEMLRSKAQVAICFDEFGGCSGVLSREDIFEEITGEIMDEYDRPENKITRTHGTYMVDGSFDLDDLLEETGLELEKDNADTMAGWIYQRLSRAPRRGEIIEEQGWRIEVVQMEAHRIRRVRLLPPPEDLEGRE